jgi:hypothetical protein
LRGGQEETALHSARNRLFVDKEEREFQFRRLSEACQGEMKFASRAWFKKKQFSAPH